MSRAKYDPQIEANWLELSVNSQILFPDRNPKKRYIYLYTLRIWDATRTSEAVQRGQDLGTFLFSEDSLKVSNFEAIKSENNIKKSFSSNASENSNKAEDLYEGVEEFRWKSYEPVPALTDKKQKNKNFNLEKPQTRKLMIPYKFKYFKCDVTLDISVVPEDAEREDG